MNKLKLSKYGYYSIKDMPTEKELEIFYKNKYYQEDNASYSHTYSQDELVYKENKAIVTEFLLNKLNKSNKKSILDVGCGEGYFAKYFYEKKYRVKTFDFSSYAITQHNNQILHTLTEGNIYNSLNNSIETNEAYDLVNLQNVLEHVVDPVSLLAKIKKILKTTSLLRISVPNDYSKYQQFLLDKEYTTNTWLCPPEHLHYFSYESLKKLTESLGYEIYLSIGDFPIEFFLINEKSNYVLDRTNRGETAHIARIEMDNFLFAQGIEKYIEYYKASLNIGFARNIILFLKIKENS